MNAGVTVPAAALPLWMRLQLAVVDAVEVPCCGKDSDLWTSDAGADREAATYRCAGCPVELLCGEYASAARETFGVWAGADRTKPTKHTTERSTA